MPSNGNRAPEATGPVGSGDYVVTEGECISSIAYAHGHFWETLWNDPGNAELKEKRQNPDLLLAGDRVVVPPLRVQDIDCATEQKHTFKAKGVPVQLALKIMKDQTGAAAQERTPDNNTAGAYDDTPTTVEEAPEPEAEANQPYRLEVDGKTIEGTTDGQGTLTQYISPAAKYARVVLRPGTTDERIIEVQLGAMDPVSEPSGAAKRLRNLGYPCEVSVEMNDTIVQALAAFQTAQGIDATGELDSSTQSALQSAHGS